MKEMFTEETKYHPSNKTQLWDVFQIQAQGALNEDTKEPED